MSAIQVNIGTTNHFDPTFAWYEIFASETNLAIGSVESNAEWSTIELSTRIIHANVSPGETWYFWVRPVYDQGARNGTLVALGSIMVTGLASVSFLNLTDTPDSYTGHALKAVAVKADETGLEFVDFPASSGSDGGFTFSGAMVRKAVDQTGANYTTGPVIAWTSEIYDTDNYHDNSTNNSFLTVPRDGKYRIGCNVTLANVTADVHVGLILTKNGSATFDGATAIRTEVGVTSPLVSFSSGPIPAVAGDDFEVVMNVETDTSIDVTAARSNFWIEEVPG